MSGIFPAAEPREIQFTISAASATGSIIAMSLLGLLFGGIGAGVSLMCLKEGETGGVIVGGIFFLVGLVCAGGAVKAILAASLLDPPSVTISQSPLYLGEFFTAEVVQRVKKAATIQSVTVTLLCREWVQYTQGTDTRTETHDVYTVKKTLDLRGTIAPPDSIRGRLEFQIPEEGMHSFTASDNRVIWLIHMHTDVADWPDYSADFELSIAPRLAKGEVD